MIHHKILTVPAAHKAAVMSGTVLRQGVFTKSDGIRPNLVHISLISEVVHIRSVSAGGAHINLQANDIAFLTQACLILGQHKVLQVHKTVLNAEGFHCTAANIQHLFRQFLYDIIDGVVGCVDHFHQVRRCHIAGLKNRFSTWTNDGIIGADKTFDHFFHDINMVIFGGKEILQLFVTVQAVSAVSTHSVVRLDHHRIPHRIRKGRRCFIVFHNMVPCSRNPSLLIICLHSRLALDPLHVAFHKAGSNMELGPQFCIPFQPILIVGFQPINLAVFIGKEGNSAEHFIIIFQVGNLIILVQGLPQLMQQVIIRTVANAQHMHAIILQFCAELPVGSRKVWGNKNKILHTGFPFY